MDFDIIDRRLSRLRALMRDAEADAFVLLVLERFNSESCHYVSGFRGSAAALIVDAPNNYLPLNLTPSVVYRITALAYGRKQGTLVVLQQTYAPQKTKD